MSVKSAPGQGSTFTLKIPVDGRDREAAAGRPNSPKVETLR